MNSRFNKYLKSIEVGSDGGKISLKKDFRTDFDGKLLKKPEGDKILEDGIRNLDKIQDKLFAYRQYSILIILQAMDAAGKDSAIKHVMSGLNPRGVHVTGFKFPSLEELDHDFFWRYTKELPRRGQIAIFNRSHYENVLVTRVHPEYILDENLPEIDSKNDINGSFWEKRFKQINRYEKNLHENGTVVLKFFLYLSKSEQKKRFIERIDNPEKNWKFSVADVQERAHWDKYIHAYEEMLPATSTTHAPWFVIPADDKWFAHICISSIIDREFGKLKLQYPEPAPEKREQLQAAKLQLETEGKGKKKGPKGESEDFN